MRSMTGFGRAENTSGDWQIEIEVSGVNRKQTDVSLNIPASLQELDGELRRILTESVSRGRIQARVILNHAGASATHLNFDEGLASQYIEAARSLSQNHDVETRLTAADLFRAPGLFRIEESNASAEDLRDLIRETLQQALSDFRTMQEREGSYLRDDLAERIDKIEEELKGLRDLAPRVPQLHREHLHQRLKESGLEINLDDDRVLREIALFAERSDITEELTRLDCHIGQFREYLATTDAVGRSMDFLCQELNREFNTIGSKANDAEIAQRIVNAKTELEKIREQVQNVQ